MNEKDQTLKFYDPRITLGNWIAIGVMIFQIIYSFSKLATRDELASAITEVKREYVSREVNRLQVELLTSQVGAVNVKLEEVRGDIKDQSRILREIQTKDKASQ